MLLVRPPAQIAHSRVLAQCRLESIGDRVYVLRGINPPESLPHKRLVRNDETQEPVRILLVVAATNPKTERRIRNFDGIAPIFRVRLLHDKALKRELLPQKSCERRTPAARIDLLLLAVLGGKCLKKKLNMGSHKGVSLPGSVFLKNPATCSSYPCLSNASKS